MLFCFLDTNIFIQCQDVKDIDWKSELGASEACLVIAPVVFEELDVFKDDPRNSRKRDRARRTIKLLELILDSPDQSIREGVTLEYGQELEVYEFGVYSLNSANNDDRLVACAISWSHRHPEDRVMVVSHDSGPRRTARRAGLTAKELSDKCRLPDQLDPRDKENRELRNQVLRLQNTQPKLEFGFRNDDGTTIGVIKLKRGTFEALTNEKEMQEAIRSEYERLKEPWNLGKDKYRFPLVSLPMVSSDQTRQYRNDLHRWIKNDYRNYLIRNSRYRACKSQNIVLPLLLKNTGSAPAKGTSVEIIVRGCRAIYDKMPEEPGMPTAPSLADYVGLHPNAKRWVHGAGMYLHQMQYNESPIELETEDTHQLDFSIESILHHTSVELGDYFAVIDEPTRCPVVVALEYRVITENHPDKLEGELKVIIEREAR